MATFLPSPHLLSLRQVHDHLGGTLVVIIVAIGEGVVQQSAVFVDGHVGVPLAVDGHEVDGETVGASVGRREDACLRGVAAAQVGDDVVKRQDGVSAHVQACRTVLGEPHGEGHWREMTRTPVGSKDTLYVASD